MNCSAHLPLFLSSWHLIPLPPLGISPNFCSENSKCQELAFQPPPWSEDAGLWLRLCHSNLSSQKCNWTSDRREWNSADLILQRMETMAADPWPCWCPAWGGTACDCSLTHCSPIAIPVWEGSPPSESVQDSISIPFLLKSAKVSFWCTEQQQNLTVMLTLCPQHLLQIFFSDCGESCNLIHKIAFPRKTF